MFGWLSENAYYIFIMYRQMFSDVATFFYMCLVLLPLVFGHDVKLKESDFLQQSEPTFVETTTTEMDPLTQERVTRTMQVVTTTTTIPMAGGIAVTDDLRESMQKIVDQFMAEERKGQ